MIRVLEHPGLRRGTLLGLGLAFGLALALATSEASWQAGAVGLGFALAALVGLAQTCSA